jgi:outer membrane lipoprotein-sorting protein
MDADRMNCFLRAIGRVRVGVALSVAWLATVQAEEKLLPGVEKWIDAQKDLQTWSADFVQTRTLKSLTQPLMATGHVWFAAPAQFRWELGQPPRTIAVRGTNEMLVIYPRLKVAERYPSEGESQGPWRDALSLLEAGFPRSTEELLKQYTVLSQASTNDVVSVSLQPKSAAARRMIPRLEISFDSARRELRSTALTFADGSTLKNDFSGATLNRRLDPALFTPTLAADYKVVEPLTKPRSPVSSRAPPRK